MKKKKCENLMDNNKKEIIDYFEKKLTSLPVMKITFDKTYQLDLIGYLIDNFKNTDIQLRFIELLSTMNLNSNTPFKLINDFYMSYLKKNNSDFTQKEKVQFTNSFSSYLSKNTQRDSDNILNIVSLAYEAFTVGFEDSININLDEMPDFNDENSIEDNFISEHSFIFDEEDPNIVPKSDVKKSSKRKVKSKNLNPTKMANICIKSGFPENLTELNENIARNRSFSKALVVSLANIASLLEINNEITKENRENYLKIFKLLDEETINYGIRLFINNVKEMEVSDRQIIRFYKIWQSVITDYKKMSDYQKRIIQKIFDEETVENFNNYRKLRDEFNKEVLRKSEEENKAENEIDIENVKIDKNNLVRFKKFINYIYKNVSFNEEILNVISNKKEKWEFIKLMLNDTVYTLHNNHNIYKDEDIEKEFKPLIFTLIELPIDEYEISFSYLCKLYYNVSGKFFPYLLKSIYTRLLRKKLEEKYGSDAGEFKMYIKITTAILLGKKYSE